MRIRTIKPEFWANEDLASLHVKARLLAIGLLNCADDEGYFNANPNFIQSLIFPFGEEVKNIEKGLKDLESIGYVKVVEVDEIRKIGVVVNFTKHQYIQKRTPSKLKDTFKRHESINSPEVVYSKGITNNSGSAIIPLPEEYDTDTVTLSTGKEGKGKESSLSLTTCAHAHEGGGKYPKSVEAVIELARSIGETMSHDEAETYFIERAKLDWKTCKGVKIQRVDFDLKAWCKKKKQERYDRKSKEPKKPEAYGVEAI